MEFLQRANPELALLFQALRSEFDSKVSNLKAWGVAMTLAGGTLGGFVAELVRPGVVREAVEAVILFGV